MNRNRYRTIFSKRLGTLVPVAESCKANGKGAGTSAERGFDAAQPADASNVPGRLKTGTAWILAGAALWSGAAWGASLPTGGVVTGGTGTISQNGTTLTVNQSSQSLTANWQSFGIGAGNTVVFNQPNGASVALNRIVGNDASAIYGNLQANGQVFLVNPNGILFAPGSQVSVGGLVASTLAISDADASAGRYRFTHGTGAGSVVNEGRIDAGSVVFAGPRIVNNGTIATPGGRTTFAAGDQVTVSLLGGLLTAQVDASAAGAEIANHGSILADGGRVDLVANLVNTDGIVQARGLREDGGRIFLDGGTVKVGGVLDASASAAGRGGDVHVLGDEVTVAAGARIDASGHDAGGTVLVGGDYQGKNPAIRNARDTTVEQGAAIRADGGTQGGCVIVWSDGTTRFAGDVHAAGKGFAEVSGKGELDFSGNVNTGGGTLLLDPALIKVQNSPVGDGTSTFNPGQIKTLLMSNDVVLTADAITWNGSTTLDYDGIGTRSLTLALTSTPGNKLTFSGSILDSVAGGDKLNVTFNASNTGAINVAAGSRILSSGGDIVMRGGSGPLTPLPAFTDPGYAAALDSTAAHAFGMGFAFLDAGGGNITIRGVGTATNPVGVSMGNGRLQTSGSGSITVDGMGMTGAVNNSYGIGTSSTAPSITTVDGTVSVQGLARGTGTGNAGMSLGNATVQATGNGNVIINGQGAAGGNGSDGILLTNGALQVFNGAMTVTGSAAGTGTGSNGIEVTPGSVVVSTGSGSISLDGATTATGASNNRGIVVSGGTVQTTTGTLTLQGSSANPAAGAAISLESGGTIGGAGQAGAVTLTGDTINLASGQVAGTGSLILEPLTPATSIGVGTGASGTFNLASTALGLVQDGFSSITIGRADGSGAVDVRTASFTDPVTIRTPAGGGSIAVNGTLSAGTGSVMLQAGGNVALNNGTISTGDALTLTGGTYTVTGASALNSNTLAFGNSNGITNTGTLTLNQSGDTTIANAVGGTGSLVKTGTNTLTVTGTNTYAGTTTVSAGTLQVGAGGTSGTLGAGAVTNAGTLVLDRADAFNVANVIDGTGSLVQAGTGTTTLANANTYSGPTTVTGGVLRIGADNNLGMGGQLLLDGGTLETTASFAPNRSILLGASGGTFDVGGGTTLTYGGVIAGTGALTKADAGTLTLTGTNTYGGTTTVSGGTLQIGAGGTTGTLGTGAVTDNASLVFNRSDSVSVANAIGGTGSLAQAGTGTLILTGTNTYGGATAVNAGTLQVGSGGTSGTLGTGAVTNNGTLVFDRADALTVANTIGGTGSLLQVGGGTTTLAGANTYSGPTTVTGGALRIGTDNNLGTGGTLTLDGGTLETTASFTSSRGITLGAGGGTFDVDGGTTLTVGGVIAGTGALTKADTGTQILTGANTYGGTTTVGGGMLQIGAGGTSGTLGAGAVTNDGSLVFNRSDSITVANAIGGAGDLTQAGTGTAILTANNTYSGATAVNAGTLQAGSGGGTGMIGTGAVTNDGALVFNRSDSITVANAITGAGNVTQAGSGTAIFTGNNTYGGATTISAGTLQVGTGGTSGTLGTGAVTDNGSLVFNRSDNVTVGASIGGTGSLTQSGAGTTILAGANTYGGTTTISAGTLQVGAGGTAGTLGAGAITNNGTLVFDRSDALNVANVIGGTGNLLQTGTGTTTLAGTNTYSGSTTVTGGVLRIGADNNLGTGGQLLLDGGTLETTASFALNRDVTLGAGGGTFDVDGGKTLTYGGGVAGTGALTKADIGTLILTGTNTYGGTTTISGGTLQVGAGGTSGTPGTGAVTNNASLVFNRSDTATVANAIGGTGSLTQAGTGTLILTGTNTYAGTTTVSTGTLQVGAGGTTGTLGTGAVTDNGSLVFNRSDNVTVGAAIGGTGGLTQAGAGTTILTGANTYAGTTTINAGTLQIGAGGTTGTLGAGAVTNNGALVFDRSDAINVANVIGGTGNLLQVGSGTTTLAGANTYAGSTTVTGGVLRIGADNNLGTGGQLVLDGGTLETTASFAPNRSILLGAGGGTFDVDGGTTLTVAGVIAGTGALTKADTGTLILTGANTYGGATTVGGGTLQIGSGGTTGTLGTGAVTDNGALVFNRSDTATVANTIGGTGSLTQAGTGTTILTGTNTYGGTTAVNVGTLQIGAGGTSGTLGAGAVTNNGSLVFNRSDALDVANVVGGTGNLLQIGTGTTTLGGANTYSGSTTVTGGVLRIGADNNLGTGGTLTLDGGTLETTASFAPNRSILLGAGGGTFDVDGGTTLTYGGVIAGTGALTKADTGTLVLTGTNTYGGATTVSGGTLQVGAGGTTGTLGTGAVIDNASLVFNRSDTATVANTIGGTGRLTQAGTGTLILTGANTYGTTTVNAGTLQIGTGGTTGSLGTGAVTNNGALVIDRSDNVTVANAIGGAGNLTQAGTGTTTLTGANTYGGTTTVSTGTLQIGSGGTSGTLGTGAVTNNGALVFNRSDRVTVGAAIGGTGSLTQAGAGTTILAANNNYGGTTTISAGTLQVGAGGTTGTLGAGAVTNNGTLVFDRSDALNIANTIGGTGNLLQTGAGTTTLAAANTYSGSTTVTGGTLRIGADNKLGTGGLLALDGGTLETTATFALNRGITLGAGGGTFDVDGGTTLAYGAVIAGPGALAKADAGTLTLTGNNTYAGTTTVSGGALQVGNKGTTGTLGAGAVTDNANLVFDRADSTNLATLAAGGITGTGNVSVLAGGNLDVNRTIALTGAGSTILLEAGRDQPAGTAAGGDVTLTSNIGTSATGTVTIFSGNATTAAYEAKIGGATGPTRYKTYNASTAATGGAVPGTRNYAYRQGSGTLSVGGLSATKTYDGLVDATAALNAGNAAVAASADGDLLVYGDLTQVSATFDSAHAGSRTVTATFTAPTDLHYAAGGADWSVARFSGGTVTGTGQGTITPREIATNIDVKGKTYDGRTGTMSTLGAPSGFVGGDSASGVSGILLAFDNPNAGTRNIVASGTGSLADFKGKASGNGSGVGAHNEVAGLASDYTVATPASVGAVIAPAPLTVRTNDDAKLLTQADMAGYNGVHFDGFVHGESVADLGGALSITRSNAGTNAAGNYAGVLVPGGYTSSNYTITYANGDFRILPAQQLLVRVQNVQNDYGTSAAYAVTGAQYLDADGRTVRTLTQTARDGNTFTYSDGLGGGVTFTVTPQGVVRSGAGQLAVGNYALAGTGASVVGDNFTGLHYVGNQAVNRIGLAPQANGVTKVYDGTTAATGVRIGLAGLLPGDAVGADAAGAFSSKNAGTNRSYTINGMTLHGADAGNYYLAAASLGGNDGTITPRPITVIAVSDTKVYDGTHGAAATPVVTGSLAAGDSFSSLSQAFTSANVGMNVTLTPQAQIDDGNGGANYALTLVDNTTGVIRAGVDVGQVGVPHVEAALNRDHAERQPVRTMHCDQGVYRDACTVAGDGVYRIVARGLKLPPGLVLP